MWKGDGDENGAAQVSGEDRADGRVDMGCRSQDQRHIQREATGPASAEGRLSAGRVYTEGQGVGERGARRTVAPSGGSGSRGGRRGGTSVAPPLWPRSRRTGRARPTTLRALERCRREDPAPTELAIPKRRTEG